MGGILWVGFLVVLAGAANGAEPTPLRADSNLVLIGTNVVDNFGHFVPDLRKTDFEISEGGVPQQITSLSEEDAPLSAVIVFDASGSMARSIPMAENALREFLSTANPKDEFSVVTVRTHPKLALRFIASPDALLDSFGRMRGDGRTALLDSVYLAAGYARRGTNPRKAILVISDGEDNNSRYTETEVLNLLRESDVTLYSIGVDIRTPSYSPGQSIERTGADLLAELAEATGGRYFEAWAPKDLPEIMSKIDIRREYVIGYSPSPMKADGKYHRVEVRLAHGLRQRHLHAYARPGYYAPLLEAAR